MKPIHAIVLVLFLTSFLGSAEAAPNELPRMKQGEEYRLSIKGVPEDEKWSFNGLYRIDAKGDIVLPLAGRIHVEGMTIEEARDEIEKTLKDRGIYNYPKITIDKPVEHRHPK